MVSSRGHLLTNSIYCMYSSAASGGDEIIHYVISCIWNLWTTVLNSRTLEEYQI